MEDEKSKISRILWYVDLLMGSILLVILTYMLENAVEFREAYVESGKAIFIIWGIETWFAIRLTVFISAFFIGTRKNFVFRRERERAIKNKSGFMPKHIDVFQFPHKQSIDHIHTCIPSVMNALAAVIEKHRVTATYVIMITDKGDKGWSDVQEIGNIIGHYSIPGLRVVLQHQEHGKRDAFGKAFDILSQDPIGLQYRPEEVALVTMDGDSEIPKEFADSFFEELLRPLSRSKKIGGVTCHNFAKVNSKSPWVTGMYNLRFLRRFYTMSATANVLTGRIAAFSGIFSRDPGLRNILVSDLINHEATSTVKVLDGHPLLAPFRLIHKIFRAMVHIPEKVFETATGDDKSTIFFVFKKGYDVVFNPDLYIVCHEDLPYKNEWLPNIWFFQLPAFAVRYCRNTMNNNPRMMKLGVERLGWVRYISLLSDRYFFWTPLVGLLSLPFLMNVLGFEYLYVYVSWVILSRTFMTLLICLSARQRWSPFYPIILYNEHTVLVLVKIWAVVSAISNWTRQDRKVVRTGFAFEVLVFCTILSVMTTVIGIFSGALWVPDWQQLVAVFGHMV